MKNPFESLQDYFDELLLPELPPTGDAAKQEQPVHSASAGRPASPSLARVANPASKAAQQYAEPELHQKEKLQKLLSSARANIQVAPVVKVEVAAVETKTKFVADPHEIQEWVIETAAPIVAAPVATVSAVTTDEALERAFHMPGAEWMPNGRPQWAQSRFDVLLFKVSGLTLAVPLISLGQIQPLTEELTPLFGQADWFMGLQPTPQGKIRTVNTAKFVMPERYDESFVKSARYVVSINGVPWGLAVDSVNQPISLMPDDVKWRTDRSKRPWLAGTVKEHMCALLDIPMIGQMLINADKNAMKSGA